MTPTRNGRAGRAVPRSDDWAAQDSPGGVPAHRTLAEKAFISLHDAILTGKLLPGERIPIEDLAAALQMSPMPVREAIRRLDSIGLVENVPHKGARITELSVGDLFEIYEARISLEPLAIARAARRFTPEDEARARALLRTMRTKPAGSDGLWRAHSELHMGLYRTAASAWMLRLIRPLWESSERYRLAMSRPAGGARYVRLHEILVEACVRHEPRRAAFELHNHLVTTANSLARQLGSEPLFSLAEGGELVPPALEYELP